MSPVSRLKHTWAKLSGKSVETFEELSKIQDPSNSFKNIRDQLDVAGGSAIPYMYLLLSINNFALNAQWDVFVRFDFH